MPEEQVFLPIFCVLIIFLFVADDQTRRRTVDQGSVHGASRRLDAKRFFSNFWQNWSMYLRWDSFIPRVITGLSFVFIFIGPGFGEGALLGYLPLIMLAIPSVALLCSNRVHDVTSNSSVLLYFIWASFGYTYYYGGHLTWLMLVAFGPLLVCLWRASIRGWQLNKE